MKTYFEDVIKRLKTIDDVMEEYSVDDEVDAHDIALKLRKILNDAIDEWSSTVLTQSLGEEPDIDVEAECEVDAQNVTVKDFGGEVLL